MSRILVFLPVLIVAVVGGFLWWGLVSGRDPSAIPSALIGAPAPEFALPPIAGTATPGLQSADLVTGSPLLLNVFASWCVPCRAEHAALTRMARDEGVTLMGINYQDKPADAAAWLAELGNPYQRIGSDLKGRVGVDWGISGVPETFVVDGAGVIVYRHVGPIVGESALRTVQGALATARGAGS